MQVVLQCFPAGALVPRADDWYRDGFTIGSTEPSSGAWKACEIITRQMDTKIRNLLRETLVRLSDYMQDLYPGREFGTRFWELEDDDLFYEALGYLPLVMPEEVISDIGLLSKLPRGYELAFPIFWIEDDYWVNGWTALSNAGEWLLPVAINAYREIGMHSEADALSAALAVIRNGDDDYYDEATEAAYKSVPNDFRDDEVKNTALLKFFRSDRALFDFDGA